MKIRLGDKVQILAGKDKGRESVVSGAFPAEGKVTVEGYNIAKRHTKPISAEEPGGIIDKEMKMDVSNVAVISPGDGKPTRVGYKINDDGTKVRVCKRTGSEIPEVERAR